MKNRMKYVVVAALALMGCGEASLATVAQSECASGKKWTGGDEESELMHPGMDCIGCHTREHEGPIYTAAGTVYGKQGEKDDCGGVEGLTVEFTGNDGAVTTLKTNAAGNFFTKAAIAMPYTVKVIDANGAINRMATPQSTGACGSCHTVTGENNAPGRVLAP